MMSSRRQSAILFVTGFLGAVLASAAFGSWDGARALAREAATQAVDLCFGTGPTSSAAFATYTFDAGKATFGVALPQGVAAGGVRVGTYLTQTDVKKTWPDGSIRFAIVSADVTQAGDFPLYPDQALSGGFAPTWPQVTVEFGTGGTTYTAALPSFSASDTWLSGPVVQENRAVVVPVAGSQPHPLLRTIFDVRSYAAGGHRVDIAVDNIKDVANGVSITYNLTIRVGGAVVFQRSAVQHAYLTRWRKTFQAGGLVESGVKPDFATFIQSGMLPRYLTSVANASYGSVTDSRFDILRFGDMTQDMASPGGRPEIAPLPYFTAQYLVHRGTSQRALMMKNADLSGSWSGHITNPDGSLITITNRPNYWLDYRGSEWGGDGPLSANGATITGTTSQLENAHIPSLNYVPYLVTGDRWHLDQIKLWANAAVLMTWHGDPDWPRTNGVLVQNQPRGFGWGLRLVSEAAAATPDADPARQYFSSIAQANVNWLDNYASTDVPPSALRDLTLWQKFRDGNTAQISQWQLSYLAYALYHAKRLGFASTGAFIDRVARFQVSLLTSSGAGYPSAYGAPYYLSIGTINGSTYSLHQTLAQVFAATYNNGADPPVTMAGYYGPETAMLLRLGVLRGVPNSTSALSYVLGQGGVVDDINARSGFALAFD